MEFIFDLDKNKEKIEEFLEFIDTYKDTKGALMPVLQHAQDFFGYLPKEILEMISKELKTPLSEVYGVVTFYSQFSFVPKGENKISICLGTACYVKGAQGILEEIESELGIKSGGTTKDLKFSIDATRCLGDCSLAPVIMINEEDVYPRLKKEDIKGILDKYR